ncbi:hypothetical protein LOTGIDRAFT_102513, partial [Lottia gigantea]
MENRRYKKESTVRVKVTDLKLITLDEFIEAVEGKLGEGSCFACVPRYPSTIEITVDSVENANLLCEGLTVNDLGYEPELCFSPYIVVSFFNLPPYLEDDIIVRKLERFGVEIVGPVVRHFHKKFPNVADGTRHVKCKFPPTLRSLPWAMNFETLEGPQSFKILHNNQTKVCYKCLSPDHEKKECPQIKCAKCRLFGHMAFKCPTPTCEKCEKAENLCKCEQFFDTNEGEHDEEIVNNNKRDLSTDKSENNQEGKKQKKDNDDEGNIN